jgi:hypothetical protein
MSSRRARCAGSSTLSPERAPATEPSTGSFAEIPAGRISVRIGSQGRSSRRVRCPPQTRLPARLHYPAARDTQRAESRSHSVRRATRAAAPTQRCMDRVHDLFGVESPLEGHHRPPCCDGGLPRISQDELEAFLDELQRMKRGRRSSRRRAPPSVTSPRGCTPRGPQCAVYLISGN